MCFFLKKTSEEGDCRYRRDSKAENCRPLGISNFMAAFLFGMGVGSKNLVQRFF